MNESRGEIEKHEQKLKEVESLLIRDDKGLWKCGVCGKTRKYKAELTRHVETKLISNFQMRGREPINILGKRLATQKQVQLDPQKPKRRLDTQKRMRLELQK